VSHQPHEGPGRREPIVDCAILVACWAAVRLPFLGSFDLVSHDGTYYITQASHLLHGAPGSGGSFPPGYPILVAAFMTAIHDGVRAAQAASAVSAVVATIALYALSRRHLPRWPSLACAAVFCATPLVVRSSLTTMSESAYIAWLLLGLLADARGRRALSGVCLGAAAVTRPEALAVAAAVAVVRAALERRPAPVVRFVAAFAAVYSLNLLVPNGIVPKWNLLGAGARDWRSFDAAIGAAKTPRPGLGDLAALWGRRMPGDAALLFRHVTGVALVLCVVGAARRPTAVLSAFIPFFVDPLFAPRTDPRFVVAFVPVCLFYAFVGAESLASVRARRASTWALVAAAAAGLYLQRGELTRPVSDGFVPAREAGLAMRARASTGVTIAGRKPFVAFYAGADYMEVPLGHYEEVMEYLYQRADYVSLMSGVADFFRPELSTLLYDETSILGELRYWQVYANEGGVMVYERSKTTDATGGLGFAVADTLPDRAREASAAWSPDGARIVVAAGSLAHALYTRPPPGRGDGGREQIVERDATVGEPSWSPDGARVAFVSTEAGNSDVFVLDVATGEVRAVTTSIASDVDPCWDGPDAVAFASDRSGRYDIWRVPLRGHSPPEPLTSSGGNRHPSVSPDRKKLAFVNAAGRVTIRDRERRVQIVARGPAHATSAPSWSPDARFLAVSADDLGDDDVYLVTADASRALRLTKYQGPERSPRWHPLENRLVATMTVDGRGVVAVIDGLEPYLERLAHPPDIRVFSRPAAR